MNYRVKIKIIRFLIIFIFFQFLVWFINNNFDLSVLKNLTLSSISLFGFKTYGDFVYIPQINAKLRIVNLCTGILMYFTLISLFFAFFDFKKAVIYSVLFIPIVFFINLIRIILTCIFTKYFGYFGVLIHDIYWICDGIITFVLFYITKEKINAK